MRLATLALASSLLTAGCAAPVAQHVSTDLVLIAYRPAAGHHTAFYAKRGVRIAGEMCGTEYVHAVNGVPEAEREVARCRSFVPLATTGEDVALSCMFGSLAAVLAGLGGAPAIPAAAVFGVSIVGVFATTPMSWPAERHWDAAVRLYNAEVKRRSACACGAGGIAEPP